jgi:hypothetical protein
MVAMSSLRFLAKSSPILYQPRRFQYAGGLRGIPTVRVAASASPAHAWRLSYAGEFGVSLPVVVQASLSVAHPQHISSAPFPFLV